MTSMQKLNIAILLRDQFHALRAVSAPLNLDEDRERRVRLVPERDWQGWATFLQDGPLPSRPHAAVMLRRLGAATYRLATLADRREIAGQEPWTSQLHYRQCWGRHRRNGVAGPFGVR